MAPKEYFLLRDERPSTAAMLSLCNSHQVISTTVLAGKGAQRTKPPGCGMDTCCRHNVSLWDLLSPSTTVRGGLLHRTKQRWLSWGRWRDRASVMAAPVLRGLCSPTNPKLPAPAAQQETRQMGSLDAGSQLLLIQQCHQELAGLCHQEGRPPQPAPRFFAASASIKLLSPSGLPGGATAKHELENHGEAGAHLVGVQADTVNRSIHLENPLALEVTRPATEQ